MEKTENKIIGLNYNFAVTNKHMAKFNDDKPSNLRD